MRGKALVAGAVLALGLAPGAMAQSPTEPVEEGAREQSCRSLEGGTAGAPDHAPAEPGAGLPATWEEAPAGLLPERVHLRTATETFNRRYEFATRGGEVYARVRDAGGAWRRMPLPLCFAGRVAGISLDDDEMIALDTAQRVYTMDNALKDASSFNWTLRWGTPFWAGPGISLPPVEAWSWSVVSPLEDVTWTDPAGNRTAIGSGKVSHIWGLRTGGQRLTFWDPWLPRDESYEMCGPHRGRFRAVNMSASGSFVFVVGRHGDLFTRLYDFDISGHDPVFFTYSYEDQRGKGDGAPIQLPAAPWVEQPKVPGEITSAISIHKVGRDTIHRILRVEGADGGRTGYWERDAAAPPEDGWTFHETGTPLTGERLENPVGDTSARGLGPGEDARYRMEAGDVTATLRDFNVYCSPARLRIREDGQVRDVLLHHVDGLRQQARARGLDDVPRMQAGAIEEADGSFTEVTIAATRSEVAIEELGWRFRAAGSAPPRCLARRARVRRLGIGPVRLGARRTRLRRRAPAPARRTHHAWRWCVKGGGRVAASFGRNGRAALVATTARGHRVRGKRPGSRARGRGLVRAGRHSRVVFGVRRGRVRFVAVASRRVIERPRALRAHVRRATGWRRTAQ